MLKKVDFKPVYEKWIQSQQFSIAHMERKKKKTGIRAY